MVSGFGKVLRENELEPLVDVVFSVHVGQLKQASTKLRYAFLGRLKLISAVYQVY